MFLPDADIFGNQPSGAVLTFEAFADPRIVQEVDDAVKGFDIAPLQKPVPFDAAILLHGSDNTVICSKFRENFGPAREPFERVLLKFVDVSLYAAAVSEGKRPVQPVALQIRNDRMRVFAERELFVQLIALQLFRPAQSPVSKWIAWAVDRLINRTHYKCTYELAQGVELSGTRGLDVEISARFSAEIEACRMRSPRVRKAVNDVRRALERQERVVAPQSPALQHVSSILAELVELG